MQSARHAPTAVADRTIPDLDTGMTVLRTPHHRSGALHQVALQTIRQTSGRAYWLDARNTASTYALQDLAPSERLCRRLRVARAFTAYHHRTLVGRVLNQVRPETGCVIAPNVASLYRDDDVPAYEAAALLDTTVTALADLGETFDLPVLVTLGGPDDDLAGVVTDHATAEITCEQTKLGYRFESEDFETDVYWDNEHWQTTIPYWVDLLGAAGEGPTRSLTGPTLQFAVEG